MGKMIWCGKVLVNEEKIRILRKCRKDLSLDNVLVNTQDENVVVQNTYRIKLIK